MLRYDKFLYPVLISSVAGSYGEKMPPKLDELYKNGMEAFDKEDYRTAEELFQELLSIKPDFADIQNKMGIIYSNTNRPQMAARAFRKALERNSGYTEAALNLAITYSDLGKYDEARTVFEQAARFSEQAKKTSNSSIDPFIKGKLADEHLRIGKIYYDLRELDEAIDEYQKALRLSPNFADIITHLGIALRDKGRFDDAIEQFNRAKLSNPRYIPARLHLGITYYSQGFYGLAEEEWREALLFDPENSAVRAYLNFVKPQTS
jgi:tetratricopeptide (TPR) repeat protein